MGMPITLSKKAQKRLPDDPHGAAGQADGLHHAQQVAAHEDDVRGLDRHVHPDGHRDSDIGLGQGRGIVQPVAHHGHRLTPLLDPPDLLRLLPRQDLGDHTVDSHRPRHRRAAIDAREQDAFQSQALEPADCLLARGSDRIGHRDQAGHHAIHCHDQAEHAFTGHRLEVGDILEGYSKPGGFGDDRRRAWSRSAGISLAICTDRTDGRPSVIVPVLSKTTTSSPSRS